MVGGSGSVYAFAVAPAPKVKGGGHGDLIARIRIVVPRSLDDEQREALEAYAALDTSDPRKGFGK